MTDEQRDGLIAKMLDRPEELSGKDIRDITADAELRELYRMTVELKDSLMRPAQIDTAKEWELVRPRLLPQPSRWRIGRMARMAAVLIVGALMCTAVICFFYRDRGATTDPDMMAQNETSGTAPDTVAPPDVIEPMKVEHMADAPKRHPVRTKAATAGQQPETAIDDEPEQLGLEEFLRIEQARIDNDMAMQRADDIVSLYYASQSVVSSTKNMMSTSMPDSPDIIDNANIMNLIMQ